MGGAAAGEGSDALSKPYAPVESEIGRRRLAVLQRRKDYLDELLRSGDSTLDHDRAEASALRWIIAKVAELRARLDKARDVAPAISEIADEREDNAPPYPEP